ncbi:alpha/beta hydrolase [Curtobacterium sp. MCBD17_023]|nr:alpha/beta hydrolase [Curtobacterium sp. MCBD17_023]
MGDRGARPAARPVRRRQLTHAGGPAASGTTGQSDHAVPIRWYEASPARTADTPTLLWLHGGGFFRGGLDQPEAHAVAQELARLGVPVATVDHRLAPVPGLAWVRQRAGRPRVRFPLPLDDVLQAYRTVAARSPDGVVLGGASAGACLAAAATLRAFDDGSSPPAGAVFAYGFFHPVHPRHHDARRRSRRHRRITHAPWALDVMNRNYVGRGGGLSDRFAFPGGHDVGGFPRALFINAEHDNMAASGDLFAAELGAAGVDVAHHVLPGTRHAFLNRPALTEFSTATAMIASWIRDTAVPVDR